MPEIIFKADQGAGVRKIIRIMQGDSRAHVIRFVVPRYASGVDLSPLTWYIKIVDAKNTPDIALPSGLYEVTDEELRVRWTVNGAYTDVIGSTKFQLYGVGKDADGNVINWTGGAGEIEVTENIGFELSEDQQKELNALDELIVFAQGELLHVRDAIDEVKATTDETKANKANAFAATATGNPVQIRPDGGSLLKPVTVLKPVQPGKWDPCPTGGGKNLLQNTYGSKEQNGLTFTVNDDGSITVNGTASATTSCAINAYDSLINAVNGKSVILSGCPAGGSSSAYRLGFYNPDGTETTKSDYGSGVAFDVNLSAGAVCNVAIVIGTGTKCSNLTFYPMIRLASVADATYQPYSNIRPISGRTGAELVRCGKNLLNYDVWKTVAINAGSAEWKDNGVVLTATGDCYTWYSAAVPAKIPVKKGQSIILSWEHSGDAGEVYIFPNGVSAGFVRADSGAGMLAYTVAEGVDFVTVRVGVNGSGKVAVYKNVMVETGSVPTSFEPYRGNTFALDFGQAVYGGTLDWKTGVLTVDRACAVLDGNSNITIATGVAQSEGYTKFHTGLSAADALLGSDKDVPDAFCNMLPVRKISGNVTGEVPEGSCVSASSTSGSWYLVVQNSIASTVDEMKALLAETPLQICYKLKSPITVRLTLQQITALEGVNTLYTDGDGMSVGYNRSIADAYEELKNAIIALGGNV